MLIPTLILFTLSQSLFSYFHLLAMLRIIMQYSLVKLVVDGIAAQKIDNQLAKQRFPVLN